MWGHFMIGNIGDTLDSLRESIDFAKGAGFRGVRFYPTIPFYGTRLWDYVERHGTFLTGKDKSGISFYKSKNGISFVTPEFNYINRLDATRLASLEGFLQFGGEKHRNNIEDMIYKILLNRFLFRRFDNWTNRRIMKVLSRFKSLIIKVYSQHPSSLKINV